MYSLLKSILFYITPKEFIKKHEFQIRKYYSLLYTGTRVSCPICEKSFNKFQQINSTDFLCYNCGSIPRQRLLWKYLLKNNLSEQKTLHFSPNAFFANKLKKINSIYQTTDFDQNADTDLHLDITDIQLNNESIDVILCYHVLEHIIDDTKAMQELYRILSKKGTCILQVPFASDNKTVEDYSITSQQDRLKFFGQEDHVRIYGINEFKKRLTSVGFNVKEVSPLEIVNNEEVSKMKLNINEKLIICSK
jgi:predicted SAM-dependent methyltransferase